jgi:hypothetical protein
MLRSLLLAPAFFFAACASAPGQTASSEIPGHGFVRASDECGASRYAHLVGERYAEVYQAALPANAFVFGRNRPTTLEYKPGRLNVVLDGYGRIAAIGCS